MELRELAAEGDRPIRAEGRAQILERAQELMRRLIEDHGALLGFQALEVLGAVPARDGEKALKAEPLCGKTGDGERRDDGAAAGDGDDLHAVLGAEAHEILPGVGDGGHAGVRDEGAALPREQPLENLRAALEFIVLIIAHGGLFNLKVIEELGRDAGVLRCDKIRSAQGLQRADGEVAEVPDWGGDEVKRSAHDWFSIW